MIVGIQVRSNRLIVGIQIRSRISHQILKTILTESIDY